MPRDLLQQEKLLRLQRFLLEETDEEHPAKLTLVPYYAWNNRGDNGVEGQNNGTKMLIWTEATGEAQIKEYPLVAEYDMAVADGKCPAVAQGLLKGSAKVAAQSAMVLYL